MLRTVFYVVIKRRKTPTTTSMCTSKKSFNGNIWTKMGGHFFGSLCSGDRSSFCQWIASIQTYFPIHLFQSYAFVLCLDHKCECECDSPIPFIILRFSSALSIPNRLHVFVIEYDWTSFFNLRGLFRWYYSSTCTSFHRFAFVEYAFVWTKSGTRETFSWKYHPPNHIRN